MLMPEPDQGVIDRRDEICRTLRQLVPADCVIDSRESMRAYDADGLSAYRQLPLAVVLPETVEQIAAVMKWCHQQGIKIVPRGAGTSLSGGALPLADAVLLGLGKFNRILEIDYDNRCVVAQPGVTNLAITKAVEADGFYYAPDPSSQIACSVGGNVAENSGGVHCLKYGLTTNNLLGIELVTIEGEILRLGGKHLDAGDYDLMGVMTGSEGLLGVVSEVTLRILQKPATARALLLGFPSNESAGDCVAKIIGAGIIPGGMEMMDPPAIHAAEAFVNAGYPLDVEALLIVELDGLEVDLDAQVARVQELCEAQGSREVRVAASAEERNAIWKSRKRAFGAIGRLSPNFLTEDGVVPRSKLPEIMALIAETSQRYGLRIANVFHAGDGNIHPLVLFDERDADQTTRAVQAGEAILERCLELGGSISGEHGIGVEKRSLMERQFSEHDLQAMKDLRSVFDPHGRCNPHKVFPTAKRCADFFIRKQAPA